MYCHCTLTTWTQNPIHDIHLTACFDSGSHNGTCCSHTPVQAVNCDVFSLLEAAVGTEQGGRIGANRYGYCLA